jgi:ABC-type nitrate/sulfonate/bicarbonate transport system ATPase subunit
MAEPGVLRRQQRVAIARTVALDSAILLMDEPFDAQTRGLMHEELLAILQRRPKTVVFVTHTCARRFISPTASR